MTSTNATAPHFHAGSNDPGYLPDDVPATFPTWDDAQRYIIGELLLDADHVGSWNEPHDCDDVPCPTFGDECPESKASDLTNLAEELNLDNGPDWSTITAGRSYWISSCGCAMGQAEVDEEQGLVTCAGCGVRHWYLTEGECGTYMASLPGFTCGHEAEAEAEAPGLAELEADAKARTPWPKTPRMTRQHFEYIARILAELPTGADVAKHFAYHLADTNARFVGERFIEAASS